MSSVTYFSLSELQAQLQSITPQYSKLVCIADSNTILHCFPRLKVEANCIIILAGEEHKSISSCMSIWEQLTALNVDRNALILSLGGGMITDLGSFAASCFKRGIAHINIPTSLLGMVDASVGGKTGIDFMGFKNHIGVFDTACETYICSELLSTLPERELNSAWAEVIKHYLIHDAEAFIAFAKLDTKSNLTTNDIQRLIERAVAIKSHFVAQDPFDIGVRKALNFGHTIGHAIESHYLSTSAPLLHGEAVAMGLIAESYISFFKEKISENEL
ncbi:MAG: 3-dehydroquinate synthase family protein, partial [Chitinophagales bacterium]